MVKDFGQDLKMLRESKGITIAEIAAQTRINPKFFMNIEAGTFDFQPETYMRAFIKEYARCLDVDENRILNEYDKAKGGFYAKRSILKGITNLPPEFNAPKPTITATPIVAQKDNDDDLVIKADTAQEIETVVPNYKHSDFKDEVEPEFSNRSWTQKILLGVLIVALGVLVWYLIGYLNDNGDKKTEVKPKTFNEMSTDYENKLKGNTTDSTKTDSAQTVTTDSLKLSIVVSKDTRVKIYVDENKIVESVMMAKDTLRVPAKDQFRFSASGNSSVDLYLNGKMLRKPASMLSATSIKNLIIKKDGIVTQ